MCRLRAESQSLDLASSVLLAFLQHVDLQNAAVGSVACNLGPDLETLQSEIGKSQYSLVPCKDMGEF